MLQKMRFLKSDNLQDNTLFRWADVTNNSLTQAAAPADCPHYSPELPKLSWSKSGPKRDASKTVVVLPLLESLCCRRCAFLNLTIFNIIRWFAGSPG